MIGYTGLHSSSVCSAGFREEFFSVTGFPALPSRDLLLGKGRSLLSSTLPTLVVCDPPADTPPLMPCRRFANASPGPAELATPSPHTLCIWTRVAICQPDTTCRLGYGHDFQHSPRSWLAHSGIARYRRLSTLSQAGSILRIGYKVLLAKPGFRQIRFSKTRKHKKSRGC